MRVCKHDINAFLKCNDNVHVYSQIDAILLNIASYVIFYVLCELSIQSQTLKLSVAFVNYMRPH